MGFTGSEVESLVQRVLLCVSPILRLPPLGFDAQMAQMAAFCSFASAPNIETAPNLGSKAIPTVFGVSKDSSDFFCNSCACFYAVSTYVYLAWEEASIYSLEAYVSSG